jgi:hypothetical protein
METCMFEISIARTERAANAEFKNPDVDTRMTLAFMHMAENGKSFSNLRRYETAITRRSHQLLAELKTLKKEFPASEPPADDSPRQNCETNSQPSVPASGNCETNSPPAVPLHGKCETNSARTPLAPPPAKPGPAAPAAHTPDCETNSPAHKRYRCTLLDPKTGQRVEVTPEEWQAHIDRILTRQTPFEDER